MYRGEYLDGVEEGEGMIVYPNGNILEGEFSDGKIHGHAVFKYPNGDQREGFFTENVLDGQVIYTRANGKIIIELWKNGERLPDKEVVVHESSISDSATEPTNLFSTTTTSNLNFDLNSLRQTIRSGEYSLSTIHSLEDSEEKISV